MIYILEEDSNLSRQMQSALEAENNEVRCFDCDSHFSDALEEELPELLIMEIAMPGVDGLQILTRLRNNKKTRHLPVILLTELDDEKSIAHGLDLGADDSIQKPFGMVELCSRVRALLRRVKAAQEESKVRIFESGPLRVDAKRHVVTVEGKSIALSLKEYSVLLMLLEANGAVCTREDLLSEIWGSNYGESRTLDVHIRRLRRKLQSAGKCIQTVKGVGYRIEEKEYEND